MIALSHKPERSLYIVFLKNSRLQWLHCAISNPALYQIMNNLQDRITPLKKLIEVNAVECYAAKKYSHAYRIHASQLE